MPHSPQNTRISLLILELYKALYRTGFAVLSSISSYLGIDPRFLLDLTDLNSPISSPDAVLNCHSENWELSHEQMKTFSYSSSLLRICKYSGEDASMDQPQVSFGAHTDSSFITIGLASSMPGLEIVDQATNEWVCPEEVLYLLLTPSFFLLQAVYLHIPLRSIASISPSSSSSLP